MKNNQVRSTELFQKNKVKSPKSSGMAAIIIGAIIAAVTVMLGLEAANIFNTQQMYIVRPALAAITIFLIFSYFLMFRLRGELFGEIGFVYLALSLSYTIYPAIKFLILDFYFPLSYDGLNFAVLIPKPEELGTHLWRHVLFIIGVAVGFLVVRSRPLPLRPINEKSARRYGRTIAILIVITGCCICVISLLTNPVNTYIEHYIRFEQLSWFLRRLGELSLIFKSGGYFVLLALMFSQYRKYRPLIFIIVPIMCVYEVVYSYGSRIEAYTILLALIGFYHFRVSPISLKKGIVILISLAFIFSGIGIFRSSNYSMRNVLDEIVIKRNVQASELEAVFCTGFHLYLERTHGTLPQRNWKMFFYEFISVIPFIDHTTYHPQYWYARNYFPNAVVPPTTMGVVADSAIWGGEFDLLARSILSGAIIAFITRWFLRRREKWWALTIYIYCYATCIMIIKYSILIQLVMITRYLFPTLLLTTVLIRFQKHPARIKACSYEPVA